MTAMFARRLELPARSFFLLGPRATGKSTWLTDRLQHATWFNLLQSDLFFVLLREPAELRRRVLATQPGWVVIDEVQKLPALLDEVHAILSAHPGRYKFALTGSSARKLKRDGANLLAGRAINRGMFPLTLSELDGAVPIIDLLRFGGLPVLWSELTSERERVESLEAYAGNYVREEVLQEAAIKNLQSFGRFLVVAGLANAQVVNVAALSRDAGVARMTVQSYFDVLTDTLLGAWLPAWQKKARIKQVAHPKFYFFDTGVARTLAGRLHEPLDSVERGHLLETWVFHELRAQMSYGGLGGELSYWRTASGVEIDFLWSRGNKHVGIEVKASERWRPEDGKVLQTALAEGLIQKAYGVYLGAVPQRDGRTHVLPIAQFAHELACGELP
jgi:predicted AAA+ superfamily ATPase